MRMTDADGRGRTEYLNRVRQQSASWGLWDWGNVALNGVAVSAICSGVFLAIGMQQSPERYPAIWASRTLPAVLVVGSATAGWVALLTRKRVEQIEALNLNTVLAEYSAYEQKILDLEAQLQDQPASTEAADMIRDLQRRLQAAQEEKNNLQKISEDLLTQRDLQISKLRAVLSMSSPQAQPQPPSELEVDHWAAAPQNPALPEFLTSNGGLHLEDQRPEFRSRSIT